MPAVEYRNALESGTEQGQRGTRLGAQAVQIDPRAGWVTIFLCEGVVEDALDGRGGRIVGIQRHAGRLAKGQRTQIIEAQDVVGMRVRVQNRIDAIDTGTQRLRAKVGPCINQHHMTVVAQRDRRPQTVVARVRRPADMAVTAQRWHAHRRAGTEEEQLRTQ